MLYIFNRESASAVVKFQVFIDISVAQQGLCMFALFHNVTYYSDMMTKM